VLATRVRCQQRTTLRRACRSRPLKRVLSSSQRQPQIQLNYRREVRLALHRPTAPPPSSISAQPSDQPERKRCCRLTRSHKLILASIVLLALCIITAGATYAVTYADKQRSTFTCGTSRKAPGCYLRLEGPQAELFDPERFPSPYVCAWKGREWRCRNDEHRKDMGWWVSKCETGEEGCEWVGSGSVPAPKKLEREPAHGVPVRGGQVSP
jgi:hypothetical protein